MKSISIMRMLFTKTQCVSMCNIRFYSNKYKMNKIDSKLPKNIDYQNDYVLMKMESNTFSSINWVEFKECVLSKPGDMNPKNINAILLKRMITAQKFEPALSFAEHLKEDITNLNLGTINALLRLYYVLGLNNTLKDSDKKMIMYFYNYLHEEYKVLESTTCESLLRSVCIIDEWKIGSKLLEDIFYLTTPTRASFSVLIASLFRNNEIVKALELVKRSVDSERPLQFCAYDEWIKYILRKYNKKSTILKNLEDINVHLMSNCIAIDYNVSELFKTTYESLGCNAKYTKIDRFSGTCSSCKDTLVRLDLSADEFNLLQNTVKEKLLIGSDLFQKSSPYELKKFYEFIKASNSFDIVLDALNIFYCSKMATVREKIKFLNTVVDYFLYRDKKILLLGRQHMLKWSKQGLSEIMYKTGYFFTEDLSQDDPYLIAAAILSGPKTEFLSKDILRNHKFKLGDVQLGHLFQRWQRERQWMVYTSRNKLAYFKEPLTFTPTAQKKGNIWHIPYLEKDPEETNEVNEGIPDLNSWMCIQIPAKS